MGPYSMRNALTVLALASLSALGGCSSPPKDGASESTAAAELDEEAKAEAEASVYLTGVLSDKRSYLQATEGLGGWKTLTIYLNGVTPGCFMKVLPRAGAKTRKDQEQTVLLDAESRFTLTVDEADLPEPSASDSKIPPASEVSVKKYVPLPGGSSRGEYDVEMFAKSDGLVFWLSCTLAPKAPAAETSAPGESSSLLGAGLLAGLQDHLDGAFGLKLVVPAKR